MDKGSHHIHAAAAMPGTVGSVLSEPVRVTSETSCKTLHATTCTVAHPMVCSQAYGPWFSMCCWYDTYVGKHLHG
jgi:hypothetical protein